MSEFAAEGQTCRTFERSDGCRQIPTLGAIRIRRKTPIMSRIAHLSDAAVGYKIHPWICRLSQFGFRGEPTQACESHDGLCRKFLRQFHAALVGRAVGVVEIDIG